MLLTFCFLAAGGMWDLSTLTGTENTPPVLGGKVFTTGPPGKSPALYSCGQQAGAVDWCVFSSAVWLRSCGCDRVETGLRSLVNPQEAYSFWRPQISE